MLVKLGHEVVKQVELRDGQVLATHRLECLRCIVSANKLVDL